MDRRVTDGVAGAAPLSRRLAPRGEQIAVRAHRTSTVARRWGSRGSPPGNFLRRMGGCIRSPSGEERVRNRGQRHGRVVARCLRSVAEQDQVGRRQQRRLRSRGKHRHQLARLRQDSRPAMPLQRLVQAWSRSSRAAAGLASLCQVTALRTAYRLVTPRYYSQEFTQRFSRPHS